MIEVTRQQFEAASQWSQYRWMLRAAQEVVSEVGPDYVYDHPVCVYGLTAVTEEGTTVTEPMCLVGRILAKLGWDVGAMLDDPSSVRMAKFADGIDPLVRAALQAAQTAQDGTSHAAHNRQPWGVILAHLEWLANGLA